MINLMLMFSCEEIVEFGNYVLFVMYTCFIKG